MQRNACPDRNKFEAGTPAIASQIGLGAAIDYLNIIGREKAAVYEHELLNYATQRLSAIEGGRIIGTAKEKWSVLSFTIENESTLNFSFAVPMMRTPSIA